MQMNRWGYRLVFLSVGLLGPIYSEPAISKVVFDVGANNGDSFFDLASSDPSVTVYAFEPTPQMCRIIQEKAKGLSNYILIEKAVSDFEGKALFYVAGQADWGCSSLLEFSQKSRTEWPGRFDFVKTDEIEVEVIRLDRFVKENGILKIDYLHIDAQGSDLKVLKGLGDELGLVQEGVLEAAAKPDILYDGQNTEIECIKFLVEHGFWIKKIESNDHFRNEVNIYFSRF